MAKDFLILFNEIISTKWTNVLEGFLQIIYSTIQYHYILFQAIYLKKKYSEILLLDNTEDKWMKVQIFSLSLIFKLWSNKHYRSPSFQSDMIANLSNISIPGMFGVPLHIFAYNWFLSLFFILFVNPLFCFFGAIRQIIIENENLTLEENLLKIFKLYKDYLYHPSDWFSLWRLNCRLISYHSLITQTNGYQFEDKWLFLQQGKRLDIPISPYLDITSIVCKNKNIEGGMGIYFYQNALHGGDWIIQEKLSNSDWLNQILPLNAPLSTMRIITSSTYGRSNNLNWFNTIRKNQNIPVSETNSSQNTCDSIDAETKDESGLPSDSSNYVKALSGVLRLGRSNALTDHSSILFNIDIDTGVITGGTSNAHWYQLGLNGLKMPLFNNLPTYEIHPDAPHPQVTGKIIPDMKNALDICIE